MQRKDFMLIGVVAIISAALSIVLSSLLISSDDKKQSAEVVESISSVFERPPEAYFNENSINPTQEIEIQQDPNSNPFSEN